MIVYKVNSFTHKKRGGNPAGVVILEKDLSREKKQLIAKHMGFSETAFAIASESSNADYEVSFFTPVDEVPLCGHATIAVFHVLHSLKMLSSMHLVQSTLAGNLKIEVQEVSGMIFMEQKTPKGEALSQDALSSLTEVFSLDLENFKTEYDALSHSIPLYPAIWDTGIRDILLPIKNREMLNSLNVNMNLLSSVSRLENVVGVHAFTCEEDQFYARNFAPLYGIDEESATGTSNGALTAYLYNHIKANGFPKMQSLKLTILQGETMGALSEINTRIEVQNENLEIWVGGFATIEEAIEIDL